MTLDTADTLLHAIRRERSDLRAILTGLADGVIVVDADGRVELANPAVLRMLRASEAAVLDRSIEDVLPMLADIPRVSPREAAAGHGRHRRRIGGRTVSITGTDFERQAGRSSGAVWVLRDVSASARKEARRNEHTAMVAHELRTPLASIRGYVELLRDGVAGPTTEKQRQFLDVIVGNTERMTGLVGNLLDFSKLQAGQLSLETKPTDLNSAVEEVIASLRPQRNEAEVTVVLDLTPDLPPVLADSDRLLQIITNLVANAIKYTPSGGTITVSTAQDGPSALTVAVEDTGPGIAPADAAAIFKPFMRAAGSQADGAGLGLAITKALVDLHGGSIALESAPGEGSTFRVTLPALPGLTADRS